MTILFYEHLYLSGNLADVIVKFSSAEKCVS